MTLKDEAACPDFELDRLTQIDDITAVITGATSGKSGDLAQRALHGAEAAARRSCGKDPAVRCDVVSLYHGGVYDLYHDKRYTDVRLTFAPEYGIAQFGGDPDNFTFPRFNYDVSFLHAYENGSSSAEIRAARSSIRTAEWSGLSSMETHTRSRASSATIRFAVARSQSIAGRCSELWLRSIMRSDW